MIVNVIFVFELPTQKSFLNLLLFFTNFSFSLLTEFALIKKCIISLANTAVHGFFYKQLQLPRVEVPKWPKIKQLLSTKHCSGSDCL